MLGLTRSVQRLRRLPLCPLLLKIYGLPDYHVYTTYPLTPRYLLKVWFGIMTKIMATQDDFSNCLLLNTIKAARSLSRRYDNRLKTYGVTVIQFSVMMMIRSNSGKTINALADRIAMERSTLTRNIDVLVRNKLVVKDKAKKGNGKICKLTNEGDILLDQLIPEWRKSRDELRSLMAGKDPDEYLSTLRILSNG